MSLYDVELGALALPAQTAAPLPALVLVHDVWGLGPHPRALAGRLADEGFAVLAVDLYRRTPDVEIEDPASWMQQLDDRVVLEDLRAAARFVRDDARVQAPRVGIVGFCMGGSYTLLAACLGDDFAAAVPFYGILSHQHGLLKREGGLDPERKPWEPLAVAHRLRCPLLAFFGAEDPYVPLEDVRALEAELARAQAPAEVIVVEGAGHAFMNDTRPDAYRPDAARDAWRRMVAFLRERLGSG